MAHFSHLSHHWNPRLTKSDAMEENVAQLRPNDRLLNGIRTSVRLASFPDASVDAEVFPRRVHGMILRVYLATFWLEHERILVRAPTRLVVYYEPIAAHAVAHELLVVVSRFTMMMRLKLRFRVLVYVDDFLVGPRSVGTPPEQTAYGRPSSSMAPLSGCHPYKGCRGSGVGGRPVWSILVSSWTS